MVFSRQEYWSWLPHPTLGDLPHPGIEPTSLASPALAGECFTTSTTWEAQDGYNTELIHVNSQVYGQHTAWFYEWVTLPPPTPATDTPGTIFLVLLFETDSSIVMIL